MTERWKNGKALWFLVLTYHMAWLEGTAALRNLKVDVPKAVRVGETVKLQCFYDLEGDTLYSVKWYKGRNEFYRYVPKEAPPIKVFSIAGVDVDRLRSDARQVVLRNVTLLTTGVFSCEVSVETSFDTAMKSAKMFVVDLPEDGGPVLYGKKPRYQVGENVQLNCSSLKSNPAAELTWFINGERANESDIVRYPVFKDEDNTETSVVGLNITITHTHFKLGSLKIKCLANIFTLHWKTTEISIDEAAPKLAPVVSSEDGSYTAQGRGRGCTLEFPAVLLILINVSVARNYCWNTWI